MPALLYFHLQEFDSDMIVLFEDQQRINLIARKNVLRLDLKQDISDREVVIVLCT